MLLDLEKIAGVFFQKSIIKGVAKVSIAAIGVSDQIGEGLDLGEVLIAWGNKG